MICFVGDKPSKKNTNPAIAFDGTQSGKRLDKWINELQIVNVLKINSHTENDILEIKLINYIYKPKFIALGNNASKRLTKLGIQHFKLPHPSGLNRKLNDLTYVNTMLESCKEWLNAEKISLR